LSLVVSGFVDVVAAVAAAVSFVDVAFVVDVGEGLQAHILSWKNYSLLTVQQIVLTGESASE